MYIGCARNLQDIESALSLATHCFRGETTDELMNIKRRLMSPYGHFSTQDVIVIVKQCGEICGACFLIDRFFYRGKNQLKGTFLTSICIAEWSRGEGLSRLLMNAAIEECERRGSAFAILIARRAVDHFYNKFFFWGLSQYSSINVKLTNSGFTAKNDVIAAVTENDLMEINELYEKTYRNLYGSCVRSPAYWNYLIWKIAQQAQQFVVFKREGKIKGYAIFSDNNLHEFVAAEDVANLELLNGFGRQNKIKEVNLSGSLEHPLVRELQGVDFTVTQRQCSYGGHMVRVICKDILVNCLREELQEELGEVHIELHKEQLNIVLSSSVTDFESTCLLMRANYLSVSEQFNLYKRRSFNIPLMDQG